MGIQACNDCTVTPEIVIQINNQCFDKEIKIFLSQYPLINEVLSSQKIYSFQIPDSCLIKDEQGTYIGQILNGKRSGAGIFMYKNGQFYQGQWLNGIKHGNGRLIYQDGQFYEGSWVQDQQNGRGVYQGRNPNRKYKGNWSNGKQDGNGIQQYEDGSFYVGEFKEGQKDGQGKIIYKDGTFYEGSFVKGVIEGYGISSGTKHRYEGEWKNGKMDGQGKSQWFNQNQQIVATYVGSYQRGLKHGNGQYLWQKGKYYKGKWENGHIVQKSTNNLLNAQQSFQKSTQQ